MAEAIALVRPGGIVAFTVTVENQTGGLVSLNQLQSAGVDVPTSGKKRAMTPMRQMPSITLRPRRASGSFRRSSTFRLPQAHVGGVPELNQADGIHPNAEGARIIADNLWRALEPVLDKDR